MADDTLHAFAWAMAARVAHIKADATSPDDALFAISDLMH
jgi:hypothetical protein